MRYAWELSWASRGAGLKAFSLAVDLLDCGRLVYWMSMDGWVAPACHLPCSGVSPRGFDVAAGW